MLTNGSELREVALEEGNLVTMMLWSRCQWQSLMLGMVSRLFGQMSMKIFAVENDYSVDITASTIAKEASTQAA